MSVFKVGYPKNYGWVIVVAGTLTIFAALGLGRFALGMLLPSMGEALGLTASQMGLVSTANFSGYLLAVAACLFLGRTLSARRLISFALLLGGCSMFFMARVRGFIDCALLYLITGVGSGLANIPTMALVSSWFKSTLRGRAAGFIVMGSGFAIVLSGILVPFLNERFPGVGWRVAWMILGAILLLVAVFCYLVVRDAPEEVGLKPLGGEVESKVGALARESHGPSFSGGVSFGTLLHLASIYFCFGASYTVYVTFFVVSLTNERGVTEFFAGGLWGLIGLLSLFSGPIPGVIADKVGRRAALITVFSMHTMAYVLAGLSCAPNVLPWVSVLFFGLSAWGIPGIMTAIVSDVAGPLHTARVFAIVTLVLGVGQIIGPAVGGALADVTHSFSSAFFMAALVAATGVLLSMFLGARNIRS